MPTQQEVEGAQEHIQQTTESSIADHVQERVAVAREQGEQLEVKDAIFHELMLARLADNFIEAFRDADYSYEDIQKISLALDAHPNREELANLLAIPWDIMHRRVDYFKKHHLTAEEIVADLREAREEAKEDGYETFLAFNTQVLPLTPFRNERTDEKHWVIPPTENSNLADHKLAFASPNYHSLYREKNVRHLYLVRDSKNNKKVPNNPEWSYAANYSIVMEQNLAEVDAQVNQIAEEIEKKRNAA